MNFVLNSPLFLIPQIILWILYDSPLFIYTTNNIFAGIFSSNFMALIIREFCIKSRPSFCMRLNYSLCTNIWNSPPNFFYASNSEEIFSSNIITLIISELCITLMIREFCIKSPPSFCMRQIISLYEYLKLPPPHILYASNIAEIFSSNIIPLIISELCIKTPPSFCIRQIISLHEYLKFPPPPHFFYAGTWIGC